jgi:hypothetical protein
MCDHWQDSFNKFYTQVSLLHIVIMWSPMHPLPSCFRRRALLRFPCLLVNLTFFLVTFLEVPPASRYSWDGLVLSVSTSYALFPAGDNESTLPCNPIRAAEVVIYTTARCKSNFAHHGKVYNIVVHHLGHAASQIRTFFALRILLSVGRTRQETSKKTYSNTTT